MQPGGWQTEDRVGGDFAQWAGTLMQKKGLDEIHAASRHYREVLAAFEADTREREDAAPLRQCLHEAYDHVLQAETSCHFSWGSGRVHQSFDELERAYGLLRQVQQALRSEGPDPPTGERPAPVAGHEVA